MPRPEPEWHSKPSTTLAGKPCVAIYRGRKHVASLLFPAKSGDTLEELGEVLQRLWKETHDA